MLVEETGSLESLGFNYRNDNVTFEVHGAEEGVLELETDSRLVFPDEVKFEGGEATVENLQTALDQDKIMVSVKDSNYTTVMELEDPDVESEQVRALDNVVLYGYMV